MATGSELRFTPPSQAGVPHIYPATLRVGSRAGTVVYRAALYGGMRVSRHSRMPYVKRAAAVGRTASEAFERLVCSRAYALLCYRAPHLAIPRHPPKFHPGVYTTTGFPV